MWRILLPLLVCLPATCAHAGASEWITSEGGEVRLVASGPDAEGTVPAILQVKLKEGWKTYWLDPGESGIPPQITLGNAATVALAGISFPAPQRFGDGVVNYTGYDQPVAFPLNLKSTGTGGASIRLSVFLGICKDICIPVQGDLALDLAAAEEATPLEKVALRRATAALPEPPSENFALRSSRFDPGASRVYLTLTIPDIADGSTPDIFLSGPADVRFGAPENLVISGHTLTAELRVFGAKADAFRGGASVTLIAVAGERSMQTALAFE